MDIQTERLQTDCNIFIDRAIAMLKENFNSDWGLVAAVNGVVSLLQYAKESHTHAMTGKKIVTDAAVIHNGLPPEIVDSLNALTQSLNKNFP